MTTRALDTVHLIQEATSEAAYLSRARPLVMLDVVAVKPSAVAGTDLAWVTLVILFRQPHETPTQAAERLAAYLLAYQETYGRMPSLEAVQKHAADRQLKEPR
jgi:hypothetical protein